MPPLPFQGTASALSSDGLAEVASQLGVFAPEIWTVLAVETSGCGYLADRRPQILYERHIFHRLTQGQFDDGDISGALAVTAQEALTSTTVWRKLSRTTELRLCKAPPGALDRSWERISPRSDFKA